MFNSSRLNSLLELAEESKIRMNLQISIFDETMNELIKSVPEQNKTELEEFKGFQQRAMNLLKEGKVKEAQELIKSFSDGSKNSK